MHRSPSVGSLWLNTGRLAGGSKATFGVGGVVSSTVTVKAGTSGVPMCIGGSAVHRGGAEREGAPEAGYKSRTRCIDKIRGSFGVGYCNSRWTRRFGGDVCRQTSFRGEVVSRTVTMKLLVAVFTPRIGWRCSLP